MKKLICILGILVLNTNIAKAEISLEVMQGFAFHYVQYNQFNDSVFKDNMTSTNTLMRLNINKYSLIGLSDSQGNFSTSLTYSNMLVDSRNFQLKSVLGVYLMRNDNQLHTKNLGIIFPEFSVGSRDFSVLPLAGLQVDYNVSKNLDLSLVVTPMFTLFGVKIKVF